MERDTIRVELNRDVLHAVWAISFDDDDLATHVIEAGTVYAVNALMQEFSELPAEMEAKCHRLLGRARSRVTLDRGIVAEKMAAYLARAVGKSDPADDVPF